MGDGPSHEDEDLLARLNNLKHSNVSFDASTTPAAPTVASESDDSPEDLIARFQKLHGRRTKQVLETEHVATAEEERPASPTIDELLADIGPEDQYQLDRTELEEAEALLAEAKKALPAESEHAQEEATSEPVKEGHMFDTTTSPHEEQDEDAEAQAALQRILDDAENEPPEEEPARRSGPTTGIGGGQSRTQAPPPDSFSALHLPPTPDAAFDPLNLPSAPTTAPTAHKAKAKAKPSSDQEINSWCVICCADASVLCFGCDKDLYCWGCWREGHMGEDAGLEEKNHGWERYRKPKNESV